MKGWRSRQGTEIRPNMYLSTNNRNNIHLLYIEQRDYENYNAIESSWVGRLKEALIYKKRKTIGRFKQRKDDLFQPNYDDISKIGAKFEGQLY